MVAPLLSGHRTGQHFKLLLKNKSDEMMRAVSTILFLHMTTVFPCKEMTNHKYLIYKQPFSVPLGPNNFLQLYSDIYGRS